MGLIACLFPGQGSQAVGMGRDLVEKYPEARACFEEADRALGFALSRLCFEGPEDLLKLTENTQPAILATSAAAYRVLHARDVRPAFVAGHSLGEYSALYAAEAIELGDAVRIVRQRGRYMQEAVPVGKGAMAALLGISPEQAEALCLEASMGEVLTPANLNSPTQIVIAGTRPAVERAVALAPQRGAKRALPLPVSAPFHCALMKPAQERLAPDLSALSWRNPAIPLINNADAELLTQSRQITDSLVRQVCAPVRWSGSIRKLIELGVDTFIEIGPGRVLCGLVRQIDRTVRTTNVEDEKSLAETIKLLS
ncbi:MAG: ACP S-malonyltransferase [Acidobacteriota bacterium]